MYGANIRTNAKRMSNRQRRRIAEAAIATGERVLMVLLAVLAQKGGEVVVTKGTLDQVGSKLGELDFAIIDGENSGESIVRLVEGKNDGRDTETKLPPAEDQGMDRDRGATGGEPDEAARADASDPRGAAGGSQGPDGQREAVAEDGRGSEPDGGTGD